VSVPTWRLREELRRTANEIIEGRANFERHFGRVSTKPLKQMTLDPTEVLQLLDAVDPLAFLHELQADKKTQNGFNTDLGAWVDDSSSVARALRRLKDLVS
jgi:hypothetical protein